jgi:mevalonate pyrophosphate decarboxylase
LDWCRKKVQAVPDLVEAVIEKKLSRIGEHAEDDSAWLNKVITSGGGINNWEPDTETIRQKIIELRGKGLVAYYSMDTGPSVAVLTSPGDTETVKDELEAVLEGKYRGKVFLADLTSGPRVLPPEEKTRLFSEEIEEELRQLETKR